MFIIVCKMWKKNKLKLKLNSIYRASLTPVPRWVYDSLDKLAFDFIWKGGLKVMNFPALMKSQRVMWVKKLLNINENKKWKQYFNFVTRDIGGEFIFSCEYLPVLLKVKAPQFLMDLLEVWVDTRQIRSVKSNRPVHR